MHIHSSRDGVIVQNLSSMEIHSPKDVGDLMQSTSCRYATTSTAMNAVLSQSHAMCTLNVAIAPLGDDSAKNDDAEDVVSALSELGQQQQSSSSNTISNAHITYHDFKLIQLLQDSLDNSWMVMKACKSPA
eukprot:9880143-Ditylum_brightwellii.AAC.1